MKMSRYPNAIVCKIVKINNETECYIGSTVSNIMVRKSKHISDSKKFLNRPLYVEVEKQGGWKNVEFIEFPCNELKELRKLKQVYVDLYKPSYNKNVSSTGIEFTGNYTEQNTANSTPKQTLEKMFVRITMIETKKTIKNTERLIRIK